MSSHLLFRLLERDFEYVWVDAEDTIVHYGAAPPAGYVVVDGAPGPVVAEKVEPGMVFPVNESNRAHIEAAVRHAMTLPTDSAARKAIPIFSGVIAYFAAALAEVAKVSKAGNDQHNHGQPLHWARGKSMDHEECIQRHTIDGADIKAAIERSGRTPELVDALIREKAYRAWRALADLQLACEEYKGAPMAPGARAAT